MEEIPRLIFLLALATEQLSEFLLCVETAKNQTGCVKLVDVVASLHFQRKKLVKVPVLNCELSYFHSFSLSLLTPTGVCFRMVSVRFS